MLHKKQAPAVQNTKEDHGFLYSNTSNSGFPSPGLSENAPVVSEDMALEYLAGVLADIFLSPEYARNKAQKRSHILPGIDKRTGGGR
jgi:hypothetical protein